MNVYLDTSVILSRLLRQSNALPDRGRWEACYSSHLTRVKFYRTIDRMRRNSALSDQDRVQLQQLFQTAWGAIYRVALSQDLLDRASASMPTVLGAMRTHGSKPQSTGSWRRMDLA